MNQTENQEIAPWYKHRWPWLLMLGPAIVVVAAFYTFYLAQTHADDMVSDDYYKEGKYINMQIDRDIEADKRNIHAQILFNDNLSAAKVFLTGDFDQNHPLKLSLIHPAKKAFDQTVTLEANNTTQSGNKVEYTAVFKTLPPAVHWYVRIEDGNGKWRVENKWLPSQGAALTLDAKQLANIQASETSTSQTH